MEEHHHQEITFGWSTCKVLCDPWHLHSCLSFFVPAPLLPLHSPSQKQGLVTETRSWSWLGWMFSFSSAFSIGFAAAVATAHVGANNGKASTAVWADFKTSLLVLRPVWVVSNADNFWNWKHVWKHQKLFFLLTYYLNLSCVCVYVLCVFWELVQYLKVQHFKYHIYVHTHI